MAVGNTINYSIPVVGTTVSNVARINGNTFQEVGYSIGGGAYPCQVTLRPAGSNSKGNRRFGVTFIVRPNSQDDPGVITKGAVTVSVNIDTVLGSVVTTTNMASAVRHSLSVMLHSNLIEDLCNGAGL